MNAYRRLLSNTFLFSVSTFGSKILIFLLTPFYTSILTEADYGVTDLLIQTGNVLIPLVSMGIIRAVIRFGLDGTSDKTSVFTTGLSVILAGEGLLILFSPLLQTIGLLSDYIVLVLLYVLMANLHSVCGALAQSLGHVRLYAVSGIVCTGMVVGLNILFLAVFRLGITGYILSNVIADAVAALFLFLTARMWCYIRPSSLQRDLIKSMFRYCLPLIPATVCSWIINISDRYFISFLIGNEATGLYAVANKISTILLIASSIFTSAWQLSSTVERPKKEKERFFSNVFSVYAAGALIGASVLMAGVKLIMRFLAAPSYFEAWHYAPVLLLGTAVSCLGSFFASVYMAEKRSTATLVTTCIGAAANLIGNALLIPLWGIMGAAIATLISYGLIFVIRAIHSRKLIKVQWSVPRFVLSMAVLTLQCFLIENEQTIWSLLCCAMIVLLHFQPLWKALKSGVLAVFSSKRAQKLHT